MEGYQFARMDSFSVQGAPGQSKPGAKMRKNGQRAWTVEEVLQEAERDALASLHVPPGGPPPEILPGTVCSFLEVRAAHAKAIAVKEGYLRKGKDGTFRKEKRKLRSDARSLYSSVVSLPALSQDALADPVLRSECVALLRESMAHERRQLTAVGGELLMGVIHWDEKHVHAHFFAIAPQHGRVDPLHPGLAAKDAFNKKHADARLKDPKAVGEGANRAYRDAMSRWQDDFHAAVFDKAGLLRFGPKRNRLSRADYKKLMSMKAQQAKDVQRSATLAVQIDKQHAEIRTVVRDAGETAKHLTRQSVALAGDKIDLLLRESEAASLAAEARERITHGKALTTAGKALDNAIRRGVQAIDDREIDYRPATPEQPDGLTFGPKAPKEKAKRHKLMEVIKPAADMLIGFARRVFRLRQREDLLATSEKAQIEMQEAQDVKAAELRRHASVVAAAMKKAGHLPPSTLQIIADGGTAQYYESSFPDAWAVAEDAKVKDLMQRVDAVKNLDLRNAFQATRDAVKLIEQNEELEQRFTRGLRVIEASAKARGFDLETGCHEPEKATDPARAMLHLDQLPRPDGATGLVRERQRVRGS